MKILVVIPFYASEWLLNFMQENVPPDVDVTGVGTGGPHGEGRSDVAYTSGYVMEAIVDAEKKGYDAVILASGPGALVDEARELIDIPNYGDIGLLMMQNEWTLPWELDAPEKKEHSN